MCASKLNHFFVFSYPFLSDILSEKQRKLKCTSMHQKSNSQYEVISIISKTYIFPTSIHKNQELLLYLMASFRRPDLPNTVISKTQQHNSFLTRYFSILSWIDFSFIWTLRIIAKLTQKLLQDKQTSPVKPRCKDWRELEKFSSWLDHPKHQAQQ